MASNSSHVGMPTQFSKDCAVFWFSKSGLDITRSLSLAPAQIPLGDDLRAGYQHPSFPGFLG